MDKPNIFKYATKELSQDAFIFWLLDHANPKYENVNQALKNCALSLISEFFKLENKKIPERIEQFSLSKQYKNIDILLKINNYHLFNDALIFSTATNYLLCFSTSCFFYYFHNYLMPLYLSSFFYLMFLEIFFFYLVFRVF